MLRDMKEECWMPLQRRTVSLHEENIELRARLAILEKRLGLTVVKKVSLSARLREFKEHHPEASVREAADQFGKPPDTVKKAWKLLASPKPSPVGGQFFLEEKLEKNLEGTVDPKPGQSRE